MTEDQNPQTSTEQPVSTPRPPTVPNVSAGAKSGLAHEVIGADAQTAYDATEDAQAEAEPSGANLTDSASDQSDGASTPEEDGGESLAGESTGTVEPPSGPSGVPDYPAAPASEPLTTSQPDPSAPSEPTTSESNPSSEGTPQP